MKLVDVSTLPKKINGSIDWEGSVGHDVFFNYNGFEGSLKILGKIKKTERIIVQYGENEPCEIKTCHFKDGRIGTIIGEHPQRRLDYIYQINDVVETNLGKIKITNQIKMPHSIKESHILRKGYEYECLICGHKDSILETNLEAGKGCGVCASNDVSIGINDLSTTAPWVAKYLVDPNDLYTHMLNSNKTILLRCDFCKKEREMVVSELTSRGFRCSHCSSNISYPEKFMISLLNQLNIRFKRQLSRKDLAWCGSFLYDFYLPDFNIIIETHGRQHYEDDMYYQDLASIQANDEKKEDLANLNNISKYIVINCYKSSVDWIKDSILNSELSTLFSLDNVDWNECGSFALSHIGLKICKMWNELYDGGLKSKTQDIIAERLGIKSRETIRHYLIEGEKLGLCSYGYEKLLKDREQRNVLIKQSSELYCLGYTNKEIGQKLGIDNLYVHRLLKRADELGLIDFIPFSR